MFEDKSYDGILEEMLGNVSDNLDKREGSIVFDMLSPVALELLHAYIALESVLNESYGDTASRDYLILRCAERGITPYEATCAVLKGVFTPANIDLMGERFNFESLNFVVTEKITDGEYKLTCETPGVDGNSCIGQIIPIEYIDGLQTAELVELLIPGENEEDTEQLRSRYFASFDDRAFGGNRKDYIEKCDGLAGVGGTKVVRSTNNDGKVQLIIINSDYDAASSELVESVQNYFDPSQNSGEGYGMAPIGHYVTVSSASEHEITLSADITFSDGYNAGNLQDSINNVVEGYLLELRKEWEDSEYLVVRKSQAEARLLDIEGIIDVEISTANIELDYNEIPVLGGVNIT